MVKERQTSFASGELSPTLWGRSDMNIYSGGARTLLNFLVTPHGVITNRSGTQHITQIHSDGGGTDDVSRLVVFNHPDDEPALLVFSGEVCHWMLMPSDTRHIGFSTWDGHFNTSFAEADLSKLRFSQVGKKMVVCAEGYNPLEITRDGDTFTAADMSFDVPDFVAGTSDPALGQADTSHGFSGDPSHPAWPWSWQVTRVMRSADGLRTYETAPMTVDKQEIAGVVSGLTLDTPVAVFPDWKVVILLRADNGDIDAATGDSIVASRVYRGREGRYGFLGETKSDQFVDDGADPDFSTPPPQEFNPFKFYDASGTLTRTEYPSLVEHHENRRLLAATTERPTVVLGSAIGDYNNHDEIIPAPDDAAYSFEATSLRVRGMVSLYKHLVLLTAVDAFLVSGSGADESITPNSIASRRLRRHPCAPAPAPVVVGDTIFYPYASGVSPRAMRFGDNMVDVDAAFSARHLFDGYSVVDWAYATHPHSVLWVVRSDGVLLSYTFVPEYGIGAWARHEIAGDGSVEAVACRPEDGEDGVYLVVERDGGRFLERLAYKNLPLRELDGADPVSDVRYAIHLDRCVSYCGKQTTSGDGYDFRIVDNLSNGGNVGDGVELSFGASEAGAGGKVGQVIQVDDPDGGGPFRFIMLSYYGVGAYNAQVLTRDVPAWMFASQVADPATVEGDEWWYCTSTVSGLSHLEGQTVTALADGNVYADLVVSGGGVSLGENVYAAMAHVGLPYNSDFESLASHGERGRQKIVERALLELEFTRGGSVGATLDDLKELRVRQVSDAYNAAKPRRENVNVPIAAKWADEAYVAFRQSAPLPATILGIVREIKYGG